MAKTIGIVGTLDTKEEEIKYLKELIEKIGHKTLVIDVGVLGEPQLQPDIDHREVARAGGATLEELANQGDEGKAIAVMAEGAGKIARELYSSGKIDGVVSIGGTMGTSVGVAVMNALPLMTPKLMVSIIAFTPYLSAGASMDLTVMPAIADIFGLNHVTKQVLHNAAGAIAGMVENYEKVEAPKKPVAAITGLGTIAKSVSRAKSLLEEKGYEVMVFSASGPGSRAFENLIEEGAIGGALDLSTHDLICHFCDGDCDPGQTRLEAAGKKGIPQVVAPGNIDFFGWPRSAEALPPQRASRPMHRHNPLVLQVRTGKEELAAIGEMMAQKLNRAVGPTAMLIPTRGFSPSSAPGSAFYDPECDKAFVAALRRHLKPEIEVIELDMNINDPEFVEQAVTILDGMMKGRC